MAAVSHAAGLGTRLADTLDRFLLLLVLLSAALGVSFPGPGRRADAADAILITLAVLVFCTGASMTFAELRAVRTAGRRLAVVLAVSTVCLPVLAWLASHLVSGVALRGGILSAGLAPAEVASVALTGLAGGEAALAAGLLAASTAATVLLAGPILSIAGAHSSASQLGLLATLALVVALPLIAGSALRSVDPFGGREQPVTRVLGTASLLVLLWEVASQLQLRASDARVLLALLAYLAGGVILGGLLALGASPGTAHRHRAAHRDAGLCRGGRHRGQRVRARGRGSAGHLRACRAALRHGRGLRRAGAPAQAGWRWGRGRLTTSRSAQEFFC